MRLVWIVIPLILFGIMGIQESFAEKTISIQKTVDVDKILLIDSIAHLERYSQILPDYIQSSKLIDDGVGNMNIGLDWISIDTNIRFIESDDNVILEVISSDFKGTKLSIMMTEKLSNDDIFNGTDIYAELYLQQSWHMEILTSFVSDDDVESMLHTLLNGLVEFTRNPPPYENIVEEKQQFCIFGLCF